MSQLWCCFLTVFSKFRLVCLCSLLLLVAGCGGGGGGSSSSDVSSRLVEDRSVDGRFNNIRHINRGSVASHLIRKSRATYADGVSAPNDVSRPHPRTISNGVFFQPSSRPSARGLSSMVWQWGQFLDHDLDLTPEMEPAEDYSIIFPIGDRMFDPAGTGRARMPFKRSIYDSSTGHDGSNVRQQMNMITAWIDASNVYGSDETRAFWLRAGTNGFLKTSGNGFLPFNDGSQDNAGGSLTEFFVAGDVRANEQLALTAMHTLFVREHNRIASELATTQPGLSDEEIFQRARKFVGAIVQAITYNEFLPALLGGGALPDYRGYEENIDPGILNEFSTVLFRFGHSMLPAVLLRLDENRQPIAAGNLPLRDAFFAPHRLASEGGLAPIMRGLATQRMEEVDNQIVDDVRNFLFGPPGAGGMDLACLNIQRGRDHGIPDYNEVRKSYGLASRNSISEISSDPEVSGRLAAVYSDVSQIDAWVGALAEDHHAASNVGELIYHGLVEQFARLRDSDRFFYRNDPSFNQDDVRFIERSTLSKVITRNTDIERLQSNVFFAE